MVIQEKNKKPWESKTLWLAAITAVAPLIPPIGEFVRESPDLFACGLSVLFGALRFVTDSRINIR